MDGNRGVVNTARLKARRKLGFTTIESVLKDLEAIREAERRGALRAIGNWTSGQILAHLAAWIEYGYDGYPMGKPPWILRWILRRMGKQILEKGMRGGVRIPGASAGTYGADAIPFSEAYPRLVAAFERLGREECRFDSPGFGPMSHTDRIRLNLRHAELHLSFLCWDEAAKG